MKGLKMKTKSTKLTVVLLLLAISTSNLFSKKLDQLDVQLIKASAMFKATDSNLDPKKSKKLINYYKNVFLSSKTPKLNKYTYSSLEYYREYIRKYFLKSQPEKAKDAISRINSMLPKKMRK